MKTMLLTVSLAFALLLRAWPAAEEPIDWNRARQLHQRAQRGETLTAEEQAYYDRARAARARGAQPPSDAPARWTRHLTPLTELRGDYHGEDGGLYEGGRNEPPPLHLAAALKEAGRIEPLDENGRPSSRGKIVLLGIGMSNTTQEYSRFKQLADADPAKPANVVIVDGAQGGQEASRTSDRSVPFWKNIDERLNKAGISPKQVQAIWLKQTIAGPQRAFPDEAKRLQGYLTTIVNIIKERYPNARLCYLSSRIYAGYASTQLNPEPHAYESAFAVRWLIGDQIQGKPELNYDPARGPVKAPLLLWGPYLWADGETPRQADGLIYQREDFGPDGTHPSDSGRRKVAELLLKFFKSEPTTKWFKNSR